jgi:MerR family transcriptional regulator, light-induced transcriptional regulator
MYTIRRAAALTGIAPATLRMWERRYAVVVPTRTESGYRLYGERDVRTLSAMAALVAAGWSPREAAARLREAGLPEDDGPAVDLDLGALTRGALAVDRSAVEAVLDEAFALGTFEQVVDGWLMPALRVLGEDWGSGVIDVAGEHLVSARVHHRLGAAMDAAGHPAGAPRVLVGLARGSRHELGALAFGVVLQRAGLEVVYLGADLPPENWLDAARRHRPAAVVIAVPMASDVLAVRETVAVLHGALGDLPVFCGGAAQDQVAGSARPLGHLMRDAARRLLEELRGASA